MVALIGVSLDDVNGAPGVESITKQFLYQAAYRGFVRAHGFTRVPIAEYAAKLASLDDYRTTSIKKSMRGMHERFAGHTSVSGLAEVCKPQSPFYFIPQLYDDEIDGDELESLLRNALLATKDGSAERLELLKGTYFRKCARMYDFLRYGKE